MNGIKYHHDIIQNTDEWLKIRAGIVTASNISSLLTPTGKQAKGEKVNAYAYELAAQLMNEHLEDHYESYDMMRGHIQEDIARNIYADNYAPVTECGFITNDSFGFVIGCSPDGLVGEDGGIEIKSRLAKFQTKVMVEDEVPAEYMLQIQCNMLVSGRSWWDFVQYSNGMELYVKRVYPDCDVFQSIIEAVKSLYELVDRVLAAYGAKAKQFIKTEYVEINFDEITESEQEEG